jgi:hypothetical protein
MYRDYALSLCSTKDWAKASTSCPCPRWVGWVHLEGKAFSQRRVHGGAPNGGGFHLAACAQTVVTRNLPRPMDSRPQNGSAHVVQEISGCAHRVPESGKVRTHRDRPPVCPALDRPHVCPALFQMLQQHCRLGKARAKRSRIAVILHPNILGRWLHQQEKSPPNPHQERSFQ